MGLVMQLDSGQAGPFRPLRTTVLLVALVSTLSSAAAQPPATPPETVRVENVQLKVEVQHIQLSFVVRDDDGNFIRHLAADDFIIQEDGAEKQIVALREQEVPISTVVLVDNSLSIGPHLQSAARTAFDFFSALEGESAALAVFSESPRLLLGWDDPSPDLSTLLTNIQLDGQTALYDSVIEVSRQLLADRQGKKLIVLLTDGINTAGNSSFKEMIDVTRALGITLYPIIYTNQTIEHYRKKIKALGNRASGMNRLVSDYFHNNILLQNDFQAESLRHGGRVIFSNAFTDLDGIYQDIVDEMKSHYVMLYLTDNSDETVQRRDISISTRRIPGKIFIDVSR